MKSFLIAVVGVAAVNAKSSYPESRLNELNEKKFDTQKKLMEVREEGTYFQEDSDKPKNEDSMWWWNGWYKVMVQVYFGFEVTGSELDAGQNGPANWLPTDFTLSTGLWADVMVQDTNEFFDWYWNQLLAKFVLIDVKPLVMTVSAPFSPVLNSWTPQYCMTMGWDIKMLDYDTKVYENAKTCQ